MINKNKIMYLKIDDNEFNPPKNISITFYNLISNDTWNNKIKQYKFSFVDELLLNYKKLNFEKNKIINPIYVSNNTILN